VGAELARLGLAVYPAPGETPDWCAIAKTRLREESACTRDAYAAWAKRSQAGFRKWDELAAAFKEVRSSLKACARKAPRVPIPVTCDHGNLCRIHGELRKFSLIEVPKRVTYNVCPEEPILGDRAREMAEGLIASAGDYSIRVLNRWSGLPPSPARDVEITITDPSNPDQEEAIDTILIRHRLAALADVQNSPPTAPPPDWCEIGENVLRAESACTRDAYAAWAKRSAAGFSSPREKNAAFEQHFKTLEACPPARLSTPGQPGDDTLPFERLGGS
jgi:hypothetical protein